MSSRFLTVAQIAEEYGCGLRTAYRIAEQCRPGYVDQSGAVR